MNIAPLAAYVSAGGIFLKKHYTIYMYSQPVGTATVQKEGLYFSFTCICQIRRSGIYRVSIHAEDHSENLGVLIPEGNAYILTARLPQKRFITDNFSFQVIDAQKITSGICIPLASDKPFSYISKLRESNLVIIDGQLCIRLPDELSYMSSSSPTGQ